MIYFCADDYGISAKSNSRIKECLDNGALNKVSVLANGELGDFQQDLAGAHLSLHLNLLEGKALSDPKEIPLLASEEGYFKSSFGKMLFQSVTGRRKELENQLYKEMRAQLMVWKQHMGQNTPLSVDSHQHVHMIPLIFKTLLRVIKDESLAVKSLRIPAEPLIPYILTPSLYFAYKPIGLIKQWTLEFFGLLNHGALKRSNIPYAYFMGVMFSGRMTEEKIKILLPKYGKLARKQGRDIEIALHPGYMEPGERLIAGAKTSFETFYYSPNRKAEFETLMHIGVKQ